MSLDSRTQESPPIRSVADLVTWFRAKERPPEDWKVGLEHEKVLLRAGTTDAVPYAGPTGVEGVLRAFTTFGYEPFEEDGRIIASQKNGLTVSIEPGGQIELSGRPFPDVHVIAAELDRHIDKCRQVAARTGVEFLAVGYRPWGSPATSPWMPKNRYAVMRPFLAARGRLAEDMMAMTGSAQASFDFSDERDMGEKLRVALAVQPAITALMANSPIVGGRPVGWKSYRTKVWFETDPARCGMLPFVFEPGFADRPYRSYVEWALDVPMVFLRRHGAYVDPGGRTFRAFLAEGLAGERATLADWEDHLTTVFPDVRVKSVVEVRGADACGPELSKALVALWKGILYDRGARAEAFEVVGALSLDERRAFVEVAGREGLQGRVAGRTVREIAGAVVDAAARGLARQHCCGEGGGDECRWLAPVRERIASGRAPADDALEVFAKGGDRALAAFLRCA